MPLGLQSFALLVMVEQFAVEHGHDGAGFVPNRLPTVGQADNAEPPRGKADARSPEEAGLVGAAMNKGVGHAGQRRQIGIEPAVQIN